MDSQVLGQTPVAAAGGKPAVTMYGALAEMRQSREAESAQTEVSNAARVMGQKGAAARAQRSQVAQPEPESPEAEVIDQAEGDEGQPTDTPLGPEGETTEEVAQIDGDDTADTDPDLEVATELDGVPITRKALRDGFMMRADYSRKTDDLAKQRRAFADHVQKSETQRSESLKTLNDTLAWAAAEFESEPDWTKEAELDPYGLADKLKSFKERKAKFDGLQKVAAEQSQQVLQANARRTIEALSEKIPDWIDPAKRDQGIQDIARFAQELGEDPQLVFQKPGYVEIIRDAMAYRKTQSAKPNVLRAVVNKPKVQRPGTKPQISRAGGAAQSAWESFLKNPTVENGAAYQRAKRGKS